MVVGSKLTYSQKISHLFRSRRNSRPKLLCVSGNQARHKTKLADNMMKLKLRPKPPPTEKRALALYQDASDEL